MKAAGQLGITQPDVSKLLNGKFNGCTVERLMALLNAREVDIDIVVQPPAHKRKIQAGIVRVMEVASA